MHNGQRISLDELMLQGVSAKEESEKDAVISDQRGRRRVGQGWESWKI